VRLKEKLFCFRNIFWAQTFSLNFTDSYYFGQNVYTRDWYIFWNAISIMDWWPAFRLNFAPKSFYSIPCKNDRMRTHFQTLAVYYRGSILMPQRNVYFRIWNTRFHSIPTIPSTTTCSQTVGKEVGRRCIKAFGRGTSSENDRYSHFLPGFLQNFLDFSETSSAQIYSKIVWGQLCPLNCGAIVNKSPQMPTAAGAAELGRSDDKGIWIRT
jgi:hypothetical protein